MIGIVSTVLLLLFAALPPSLLGLRLFRPARMPWWLLATILLLLGELLILAVAMLNETSDGGAPKVFALFFGWLYALLAALPWLLLYGIVQGVRCWRSDKAAGFSSGRALVRQLPLILVVCGLALFLGGFLYDMEFAGIPYQDPTPEMQARYNLHSDLASVIRWTGAVVFLSGPVAAFVRWFTRKP